MGKIKDFFGVEKIFHNKTKQFKFFNKMNEDAWKKYTSKLSSTKNIKLRYDIEQDAYIASLIKEAPMENKKYLLQDEDVDMEQDAMALISSLNDEPVSEPMPPAPAVADIPAPTTPEPAINLSQFEALLNKILGSGTGTGTPIANTVTPTPEGPANNNSTGTGAAFAHKPEQETLTSGTFENNILQTEFDSNADNISFIDSKIDSGSYMSQIDPKYSQKTQGMAGTDAVMSDVTNEPIEYEGGAMQNPYTDGTEEELNEWGQSEYDEYENAATTGKIKEEELNEDDYDVIHGMTTGKLPNDKVTQSEVDRELLGEYENSEQEYYGSKTGQLTEDDDEEEYEEEDEEEFDYYSVEEPEPEPINANGTANINGQPVQIILTGVMITPREISSVQESVKSAGMALKAVKGVKKIVNFIVEKANKRYIIQYEDLPKTRTKTPFSIKNYKFQTLDEALETINNSHKSTLKEQKNFKHLISDDIANRSITDTKESTILKEFAGKTTGTYMSGWNIKNVGIVNLKNGLNETYSDITEHTVEKNTLIKTTDGQFYLLKGNLKERSELGTKKQLLDLEDKKDYGTGTVIGIYENSIKGLGQIMYKIKRTSLPLLVWK